MALDPVDEVHALQIQAGILGRSALHRFEDLIAEKINAATYPVGPANPPLSSLFPLMVAPY